MRYKQYTAVHVHGKYIKIDRTGGRISIKYIDSPGWYIIEVYARRNNIMFL